MKKFKETKSIAAHIERKNIDTDAIIPKQYLKAVTREGFGETLFDDWRYLEPGNLGDDHSQRKKNPEFFLYDSKNTNAQILVAGDNFGCGSSREHAVWALMDFGFKVIISTSFADIFYNNCFKNGLLAIALPEDSIEELFRISEEGKNIHVDLINQVILDSAESVIVKFDIDNFRKTCVLEGLDEIGISLKDSELIKSFEKNKKEVTPWIFK